jgi:hypothetical protein
VPVIIPSLAISVKAELPTVPVLVSFKLIVVNLEHPAKAEMPIDEKSELLLPASNSQLIKLEQSPKA